MLGQDLDPGEDGVFRIARRVAKDRVISTVDPDARHGHKTASRGFDGYKGHAAVDPDTEIITATTVTPGNAGDAAAAEDLITDLLDNTDDDRAPTGRAPTGRARAVGRSPSSTATPPMARASSTSSSAGPGSSPGARPRRRTAAGGLFSKDRFEIDLGCDDRDLPGRGHRPDPGAPHGDGGGIAYFGQACAGCPLRAQCTTAKAGRTVSVGPHEQALADARARQTDPAWVADYRATRPKVERKLAHLMRRRHGGRRARVRGTDRVDADFRLLAAAVNLARLAVLNVRKTANGWAVTT